ncbi:MAG: calcium-binding protein [Nitratireductor sp.]
MPVTTSVSLLRENDVNPAAGSSKLPDLAALTNGGFAMVRDDGFLSILEIFDSNGQKTVTVANLPGTNASVAQLSNGNLVVVYQDTNSILFEVRDLSGNVVVASTDLGILNPFGGATGNLNPTVVAVSGGFQIGFEIDYGSDTDTQMLFVSNAGAVGTVGAAQALSAFPDFNEKDVASVVLTNGTVAYAWEATDVTSGNSRIFFQVQSADGTVAIADNVLVDLTGTINRNPAIVALSGGGYAIIYEDNEFRDGGLTMVTYDAIGTFVAKFDISGNAAALSNPEATLLDNGMIAISVSAEAPEVGQVSDALTLVRIIDPTTGLQVADDYNVIGDFTGDWEFPAADSAITTLSDGSIVVVHDRFGISVDGEILRPVRFTTGDNTSNVVNGDTFVDVMMGGSAADFFYGMAGNDLLYGGGGADWLYGGIGGDLLDGDAGADLLFGQEGNDQIHGGDDGDFIYGGDGDDLLIGEDGGDWIYGEADDDTIMGQAGVDVLFGGTGNDQIFGGLETDTIFGENGDDRLWGQEGGDVISGQDGDDQIHGGADGDFLFGGSGFDTLFGEDGVDQLWGQEDDDYLNGGAGNDDLHGGTGNDRLYGGDDTDSLFGEEDKDTLYGEGGGDVLNGGSGDDQLYGGDGGDFLFGDAGVDIINGGTGNDQLYGGTNGLAIPGERDNFRFDGPGWGIDTIHDYEDGVDRIQFHITATLDDFTDLIVSSASGNAVLTFGADSITIIGAAGLITAGDVDFI